MGASGSVQASDDMIDVGVNRADFGVTVMDGLKCRET